MDDTVQKLMKLYKANPKNKERLKEYEKENVLGNPNTTYRSIFAAKKNVKVLESTYSKSDKNVESISTLLHLRQEKEEFASYVKENRDKDNFDIRPCLKKVGKADTAHFKRNDKYDQPFNWDSQYAKGKIFFLYSILTKRLINKLIRKNFNPGSIEDVWKNSIVQIKKMQEKLFYEIIKQKIQRMSGQKQPNPPAPAGEGKKKRRRGRGKKKEDGEPAGESRARSQSKGRPAKNT